MLTCQRGLLELPPMKSPPISFLKTLCSRSFLTFSPQYTHDLELHQFANIAANYSNNLARPSITCIKKFSMTPTRNLWYYLHSTTLPVQGILRKLKSPLKTRVRVLSLKTSVSETSSAVQKRFCPFFFSFWSGGLQQSPNIVPHFLVSPLTLNHRASTTLPSICYDQLFP